MKISRDISRFYHFYPSNVTLVGARRGDQVNFMAAAWNTGLSFKPPLIGVAIAPKRFTHDMIVEAGEFTCNFLSMEQVATVHASGRTSGGEIDKVAALHITLEAPELINCPVIASAYAAYECRVVNRFPTGDHSLFVGEVVAVHYRPEVFTEKGLIDPQRLNATLYLGSDTYVSTDPGTLQLLPAEVEITLQGEDPIVRM